MIRTIAPAAAAGLAALALAGVASAQPAGVTPDMIGRQLPLEGAPLAVLGPYEVVIEEAFGSPRTAVRRPADLSAFPASDTLPVVVWGNGGCAANAGRFGDFQSTQAGHGFLVLTTAAPGEERGNATPEDMRAALDWAFAENAREGSPLQGKIDTDNVAMMGISCGGVLALQNAADPRIDTIGVWNAGLQPPQDGAPAGRFPTSEVLADLHGPTLYINGGEVDFMYEAARGNFEAIDHVPVFYGARDNAGHSATYFHPAGGEFANVAVAWLKWTLKGDEDAGRMFTGADCTLCGDPNWETASKGF
jgi:hypothetical protein